MKVYLRLLQFARPYGDFLPLYLVYMVLGIFFGIANFTLVIPLLNVLFGTTDTHVAAAPATLPHFALTLDYIKELFNFYFSRIMLAQGERGALAYVCGVIIASVFFSNVFRYLGGKLLTKVRARVVQNLRGALYNRILDLELGYFSNERKGDLMSRLTNDVHEVEISVVNTLTAVFKEPLTIIGFFVLLFSMSAQLTVFT
ncbi:MAG: ABC transporter ATP-binding protein, partial [Hymenobacter sp.]